MPCRIFHSAWQCDPLLICVRKYCRFGAPEEIRTPDPQIRSSLGGNSARQARERSEKELARALKVGQPAVAKLERRADMYVSNLRRYIAALGGSLEITARFPEGVVNITNFSDLENSATEHSGPTLLVTASTPG